MQQGKSGPSSISHGPEGKTNSGQAAYQFGKPHRPVIKAMHCAHIYLYICGVLVLSCDTSGTKAQI